MLIDSFILQSPKYNYNEDYLDEEEAILNVFQSTFDKKDMQDDFDTDYLYYLNNPNSKDLSHWLCLDCCFLSFSGHTVYIRK